MKKTRPGVPSRFAEFSALTAVTDDHFVKLAKNGDVILCDQQRKAIELALQKFEFTRKYEALGRQEPRRAALRSLASTLNQAAELAKSLSGVPDLWAYIACEAGIDYEDAPTLLKRLADVASSTSKEVETARARRGPDLALHGLLLELERQYHLTANHRTGITNKAGKRGGPFVRFCDTALESLPAAVRPKRSIGSIWEKIYADRARQERTVRNGQQSNRISRPKKRIWVGKVTSAQLKK